MTIFVKGAQCRIYDEAIQGPRLHDFHKRVRAIRWNFKSETRRTDMQNPTLQVLQDFKTVTVNISAHVPHVCGSGSSIQAFMT